MGNRLTKIYTRTGDDGTTGMADGSRLSKASLTFAVMGDVDELNAHIGMIVAHLKPLVDKSGNDAKLALPIELKEDNNIVELLQDLSTIQHLLFNVGGELAMPEFRGIKDTHIDWLENEIDRLNRDLNPLRDFILPAGSVLVSQTHIARTVCRRAERQAVSLKQQNPDSFSIPSLKLLNRLSDWLFVLSRYCAKVEQSGEILWNKNILDKFKDVETK